MYKITIRYKGKLFTLAEKEAKYFKQLKNDKKRELFLEVYDNV